MIYLSYIVSKSLETSLRTAKNFQCNRHEITGLEIFWYIKEKVDGRVCKLEIDGKYLATFE